MNRQKVNVMNFSKQERDKKLSDVKLDYITTYIHHSSQNLLDVGAGKCYYSSWLAEHYPTNTIVALDHLDPAMIIKQTTFTYHQVDLEDLIPLADSLFDTICAFDIIEHIAHEQSFLSELFRVCKPGGVIIGSVPHDDDKFLPAYNLTFNHRSDLTHKRYYTPDTLKTSLSQAGFEKIIVDKQGGASPHVIAEFFPKKLQPGIKKCIGLLRRLGIINTKILASDLFFVAYKKAQE